MREAFGGVPAVIHQAGGYRLSPDLEVRVDADDLEDRAACASMRRLAGNLAGAAAMLRSATALYCGDVFEGDPAEEWSVALRRGLRETHLVALAQLADCERRLGDVGAAIATCHRALGFDPAREEIHRLLMRCYWQADLRALAVRQVGRCEQAMGKAGAEPGDETRSLERLIRRVPGRDQA